MALYIGGESDRLSRRWEDDEDEEEEVLQWAAIQGFPSGRRLNLALMRSTSTTSLVNGQNHHRIQTIDVRKLTRSKRQRIITKAFDAINHQDNLTLLSGIKQRFDRVGLELPKFQVRFEKLEISAQVQIGSRALPTILNFYRDLFEGLLTALRLFRPERHNLTILKNISGVVKPGRLTLLLGPPGAGKSTLLKALAGKLDSNLKGSGTVLYNGHKIDDFFVGRACSYISQTDNHTAEMTVRETLDFAARCQGSGEAFSEYIKEIMHREKERNIRPRPEIDAYMKASSVNGKKHSITTDYILKILGLEICSDTIVGDDMLRGVSGGQKKRVTTGEMAVGPRKILLMDEISTGLDSSTTFQVVNCIRNFVHFMEGTVLIALLQPSPETFNLFDDLILLAEGHLVYEGPCAEVVEFFESLGFQKPPRKSVPDFLQEVTSKMDQPQFWCDRSKPYQFIPISKIAEEFRNSRQGQDLQAILSTPYDKSKSDPSALPKTKYAVPRWEIFRACVSRELLLMKRHRFIFFFRIVQIICVATLGCTSFIRTRMHTSDLINGELYLSALFFSLNAILFNGFSELSMTLARLPVFYKQRDNLFYPAWSWSIANFLTRVPVTIIETSAWSLVMYFSVGFSPGAARFFRFVLLLIAVHQMAVGIFRLIAALARDRTVAVTFGSLAIMAIFMLGGFIIPKEMIKPWWIWGYWVSPLTYAQRAIAVNEFTATRWVERLADDNTSLGKKILKLHSLPSDDYWYWLGVGVLIAYALLFNFGAAIALTCLNPFGGAQTILPQDDNDSQGNSTTSSGNDRFKKKGMILPFQPLAMTFHNVNYFVDMPSGMSSQGISETKLQLLNNVSGVFSPGVLTALMGASGAGKTTLLDVLSGRKTTGYIEGDVKISGYPKEQSTFARISGYVEQNDIHSPELTVYESLLFSAILRLPEEVDGRKRKEFVEEVMQLVELDMIRDAVVGLPGVTGLSTEQRKRLTIAVELVANPSIIFMDEPTSGLDARAAAIVMRTVRNTVDTGRTVVCTIHQPSIEIFLSFDELLLLKPGGKAIYGGKIGEDAQTLINYFQGIRGVPPFPSGYNPANWMLEVTTTAVEERIGEDFSVIYQDSQQQRNVESSIHRLSVPPEHSKPLEFSTTYARGSFSQFKICFWRQNIIYWRNTRYKGVAMGFTILCGILIGTVFWDVGSKRGSTQALYVLMGALYSTAIFLGVNNASTVQPIISIGRTVFCRERAAGMYSALPLALAQGLVEIPYILVQTLIYCCITYFMINFERTPVKFFLYMLFAFLTFAYYTFFGIMCVGLTPNFNLCTVLTSAFYSIWNLFSGFLLPRPNIPPWWIWLYYICPVSWSLRGIITSQLGDVETMIDEPIFRGTVKEYIKFRFGFDSGMLGPTVAVLIAFCVFFFSVYVISVRFLNFQKR